MTDTTDYDERNHPKTRPRPAHEELAAVVETYDDRPDECTLFPRHPTDDQLTTWISAKEGSYVALDEMR